MLLHYERRSLAFSFPHLIGLDSFISSSSSLTLLSAVDEECAYERIHMVIDTTVTTGSDEQIYVNTISETTTMTTSSKGDGGGDEELPLHA